jgi:hypothetical protein
MSKVKLSIALLWGANVLLAAGIVIFAFQYLIFTEQPQPLPTDEGPTGRGVRQQPAQATDYSILRNLGNPVLPRTTGPDGPKGPDNDFKAKLVGVSGIADKPDSEVAYLQVTATNASVNAYRGEPITSQGEIVPELRGWTLVRLTEDGAIFTNGQREVPVRREAGITASAVTPGGGRTPPPAGGSGQPFELSQSKSRETNRSDTSAYWEIDRAEAEWAVGNMDELLNGVQLSPYSSGGVKIDSAGSFASQRGFMDGDVEIGRAHV